MDSEFCKKSATSLKSGQLTYIWSLKTNSIPVEEDPELNGQIDIAIRHVKDSIQSAVDISSSTANARSL